MTLCNFTELKFILNLFDLVYKRVFVSSICSVAMNFKYPTNDFDRRPKSLHYIIIAIFSSKARENHSPQKSKFGST